jgi:hypothetical protein
MMRDVVVILADWLQDATYGINAVRTAVPADTGVEVLPAVTVLDSTRDGRVGRGGVPHLAPTEFPCLLVSPAEVPMDQQAIGSGPWPPDASVTVLIRYATQDLDTARAERAASQTVKALWWQLARLIDTDAGLTARVRARVQLIGITQLQAAALYDSTEDAIVTGGVLVTCRVRYLGPEPTP